MIQIEYEESDGCVGFYIERCKKWEREHADMRRMLRWMTRSQRHHSQYFEYRSCWVKTYLDTLISQLDMDDDEEDEEKTDVLDVLRTIKLEQMGRHAIKMTFDNGLVVLDSRSYDKRCLWGSDILDLLVELRYIFSLQFFRFKYKYDDGEGDWGLPRGTKVNKFSLTPKKYRHCVSNHWKHIRVEEYFYDFF